MNIVKFVAITQFIHDCNVYAHSVKRFCHTGHSLVGFQATIFFVCAESEKGEKRQTES